ncbi:MAG: hypothetical protein AB7K09_12580 [Planctomycetota bacterium]
MNPHSRAFRYRRRVAGLSVCMLAAAIVAASCGSPEPPITVDSPAHPDAPEGGASPIPRSLATNTPRESPQTQPATPDTDAAHSHTGTGQRPDHFEVGPNGTVKVGNATCPVLGRPASDRVGVAYNGWWINLCCGMCRDDVTTNKTDQVAEKLLAERGVDIRRTPAEQGVTATERGH